MALAKTKIPISFAEGINTKVDDKQLKIGSFRSIDNIVFDTLAKFRKRNGYDEVILRKLDESVITNAEAVTAFSNELLLFTDKKLFSYANSIDRWIEKGTIYNVFPTSTTILRNSLNQKNVDCLEINDIRAFVFQDSGGVKLSILDSQSGTFLLSDEVISVAGVTPKIANIENDIYIIYRDGTDLNYRKVNILFPTTIEAEVNMVSNVDAGTGKFDAIPVQNKIIIGYNSSVSGGELTIFSILSNGTATSAIGITGEVASRTLALEKDSVDRILVAWSDSSDVKVLVRNLPLTTNLLAPTVIESIALTSNVAIFEDEVGSYEVIYEIATSPSSNHMVKFNNVNLSAAVGTPVILNRGVGIASKMFKVEDDNYFLAVHDSTLQDGYFLITTTQNNIGIGTITAKVSPSLGGGVITDNGVCKVASLGDSKFLVGSQVKGRTITDDGTFFSLLGINSTVLDFNLADPYQNDALGPNLHISSGYLNMYDGSTTTEHGFHLFPENVTDESTTTTGGFISDGTYQYSAVYSWIDNKGQQHRSAPSVPVSIILAGGTTTQTQTIRVDTLRLTNKENVTIELYRTETNGSVFYKITSTLSPLFNSSTVDSLTFVDSTADTDLVDNEIIYTTGSVLENIAAPSSSIVKTFNNRIVLAGLEDENKIQYSKIRFEGRPVEFNDTLTISLVPDGGHITALEVMDEKLIIFKENAVFYISGDGPNNLGQQDSFIEPEKVHADVGCVDPNSTILTPNGVFFKSNKGIYLLERNLSVSYVGAPIEDFNSLRVTSAELIPKNNQVRFLTSTGSCLVYDYFVQQWVTFTNHEGKSAVVVSNDTYYYLRSDGKLYKENQSSFSDNGTPIKMKIVTGWLSFSGLQGFKRIYNMRLLGDFKSPHKLQIKTAYNFNESFVEEETIDTSDFSDNTAYGDYSPYGDPTTSAYGGDGNVYQIRIDFKKQKCESLKLSIEDIQTDTGEGLSLSNMMFEAGAKQSGFKLNTDTKTFGTDTNNNG